MTQLTTELIVDAGHPAVLIEVVDAGFQVRARGYGRIEESLPTGLYTVRYAAADAVEERDITLRPGDPITLQETRKLQFASAAPMELTWTSHEYQQAHAQRLSRHAPPLERGHGAELFVFIRDLDVGGSDNLAQGLSLHRLDGETLLRFDEVVETSTRQDEALWAGRNVVLDPGTYRLRLRLEQHEAVEMAIVACPYWQSQVFLVRPGGSYEVAGQPILDLPGATQLMARAGQGFEPLTRVQRGRVQAEMAGEDLRLAELARQALAHGWRGVYSEDLRALLDGKWEDPLLGIFGVHLLLMRPDPDLSLAERVVERLRSIILDGFRHPDVEALTVEIARRLGEPLQIPPLEAPPILRRSWHMLVRATADQYALIAPESFTARIADQLWGAGAWLIWEVPSEVRAQPPAGDRLPRSIAGTPGVEAQPRIEEFSDRVIIGGVTLFKGGAEPEEEEVPVPEEHRMPASERSALEDILNTELKSTIARLVEQPDAARELLASLDFTALRAAIVSLSPEIARLLERHNLESLAQAAELDEAELALLALRVQNERLPPSRRESTTSRDPLELTTLVEQLGLPADRVQSAMAGLLLKLLTVLARN
jgi:hypothetical protein